VVREVCQRRWSAGSRVRKTGEFGVRVVGRESAVVVCCLVQGFAVCQSQATTQAKRGEGEVCLAVLVGDDCRCPAAPSGSRA